jgi:hypothetical protein
MQVVNSTGYDYEGHIIRICVASKAKFQPFWTYCTFIQKSKTIQKKILVRITETKIKIKKRKMPSNSKFSQQKLTKEWLMKKIFNILLTQQYVTLIEMRLKNRSSISTTVLLYRSINIVGLPTMSETQGADTPLPLDTLRQVEII